MYTSPFIWISGNPEQLKWERFKVKAIGYDENRAVNALTIIDKRGKVVFQTGKIEEVEPDTPNDDGITRDAPANVTKVDAVPGAEACEYMREMISNVQEKMKLADYVTAKKQVVAWVNALVKSGTIAPVDLKTITMDQAVTVWAAINETFHPGEKK